MNRRHLIVLFAVVLAGCAGPQLTQVASGEVVLKERLVVTVDAPWNQFESGIYKQTPTWTHDGVTVDTLQFHVGLKDGELIAPTPSEPKGQRPLAFKSGMQPAEVVDLFQNYWSRGGSSFTLDRLVPQEFLGTSGFRFEYAVIRKSDDVRLKGVAWAAIRNGELFVIQYTAPRLSFFGRHLASVEALARSARVRG
jgi:hypothetical protein